MLGSFITAIKVTVDNLVFPWAEIFNYPVIVHWGNPDVVVRICDFVLLYLLIRGIYRRTLSVSDLNYKMRLLMDLPLFDPAALVSFSRLVTNHPCTFVTALQNT